MNQRRAGSYVALSPYLPLRLSELTRSCCDATGKMAEERSVSPSVPLLSSWEALQDNSPILAIPLRAEKHHPGVYAVRFVVLFSPSSFSNSSHPFSFLQRHGPASGRGDRRPRGTGDQGQLEGDGRLSPSSLVFFPSLLVGVRSCCSVTPSLCPLVVFQLCPSHPSAFH